MKSAVKDLLIEYVETYKELYGEDSINNNVHDLCHVMDDIELFGSLRGISAYPSESTLFVIKNLLNSTARPLAQAAKRIIENYKFGSNKKLDRSDFPILQDMKKSDDGNEIYLKLRFDSFVLAANEKDKWFSTSSIEVIAMDYAVKVNYGIFVSGKKVEHLTDFFKKPFPSSLLNIFEAIPEFERQKMYSINEVKSKMVGSKSHDIAFVFFPLIHTF